MHDKRWFRLIICFFIFFFLFVFTNVYEDPGNIIHNDAKSVAESIVRGNETYIGSGNVDERVLREYMIKNMPKSTQTITFGTSTAFGIRKNQVGSESYYNLACSSLNFNELISQFGLLEINNIDYEKVIINVDTYYFDESKNNMKNPEMMVYTEYMIDVLNNQNPLPPDDVPVNYKKVLKQALSVTYFQSSVNYIRSNNSYILPQKRWGVVDDLTNDLAYYKPDGSLVYNINYRSQTLEDVIKHANEYDIETQFSKGHHMSEYNKKEFEKLIEYLENRDVEVILYICPLAPALWDRIQNDKDADQYYILNETEEFAYEVSDKYGIKITGSLNPYNLGIKDEDFWDSRHIRHERLDSFFNFNFYDHSDSMEMIKQ